MTNAARATPHRVGGYPDTQPPVLEDYAQTGLNVGVLTDLLLKALYVQGMRTGRQLSELVRLPFSFVDERVLDLQHRRMVEVRGTSGLSRAAYHFELTNAGRDRAREALDSTQYLGPAPVPLEQYRFWTLRQSIAHTSVSREMVRDGFRELVLQDSMLDMLGPAINSAKSLFLYGAPGNGKTYISEAIAGLLGGAIYIPYAIEVDGQILTLFDPIYHQQIPDDPGIPEEGWLRAPYGYDRRFVRIRRPVVMVGGELTLDQLDLKYDPYAKMYSAPFQLRANGGVLILDDFGRQRIPPRDLLNRWIVPLEKRIDFLTLHTGGKFPVPFDTLLIFATNLAPTDLVEEAFLRRIHYKINVPGPGPEDYQEIFRRCCTQRGLDYNEVAVRYIYTEWYGKRGIEPRACHPRDILDHVLDIARFRELEPSLAREVVERACRSYFLDDIGSGA
jgi:hypothetical protein